MYTKKSLAALMLVAGAAGGSAAHADTLFTVEASYDPFILGNTTITVQNLSNSPLTGVAVTSGGASESLGSIAANASASYQFGELLGGPFIQDPGEKGVPDTTSYLVSANYLGSAIDSNSFSPVSNLTGGYVDFLGACWNNALGCSADASVQQTLDAVVAEGPAPVPLPPALGLFASGLLSLAARRVRRA
jgi:hypothetical protein